MLLWAWSLFIHFVHFFLPPLIFPLSLSPSSIFSSSQVAEWAEGKEHNIYALHTILWEKDKQWKPIGMHELVKTDQVSTIQ